MLILTIVLNLIVGLGPHVDTFLVEYLTPEKYIQEADKALKHQSPDGSWKFIDYNDPSRGAWKTAKHIEKYEALCCAYHSTKDSKYLAAARKALNYWDSLAPVCKNTWWNDIGVPKKVGPATILVRESLDSSDIAKACRILSAARLKGTGQNRIWLSENVMMRAFLENNDTLLMKAKDFLIEEVRVYDGLEGVQSDWAFHQHGPQLQWGNYGMAFARDMSWLIKLFDGTPFAFDEERVSMIRNYVEKGLLRPLWKGYYDMNTCGRQITRNSQKAKGKSAQGIADRLGIDWSGAEGAFYYPSSDFGIYRTGDWYASIRCQSRRTVGMECTNSENMKGYFAADGALLIRRDGDEYNDVAACWDWLHIPGVTSYDNGRPLRGWEKKPFYNDTENVRGCVDDGRMLVEMELNLDGLTGKKSWQFFDKGVICSGRGISMKADFRVQTGVEQCRVKGEIIKTKKWIHHNGITYIPLDGTVFQVSPLKHEGNWYDIHPKYKKEMVSMDLLDIFIDHGKSPENASYSYVIIADGSSPEDAYRYVKHTIKKIGLKNNRFVLLQFN